MGQKVNPTGLRLGVNRTWDSRWYADDKFTDYLHEDLKIKEFLKEKLAQAGISRIVIERPAKKPELLFTLQDRVLLSVKKARISKI